MGLKIWLVIVVCCQGYFALAPNHFWLDMWLDRDQQGYLYFKLGRYQEASRRFEQPEAKAISQYSDEAFAQAGEYYKHQHTAQGYFNRANAMAHLEQYQTAADGYHMALALKPEWPEAKYNLDLVVVLAQKPAETTEFDGGSQGELGADEIKFDLDGERAKQAQQEPALTEDELSQDALNQLWLRRLNTKPAEFLARKFAYQVQEAALE